MPNLTIVYGPPCSGKSTYVSEQIKDNDIRFDYDLIIQSISNRKSHNYSDTHLPYVMECREMIINKSQDDQGIENVYIIATKITDKLKEELNGSDAVFKLVETSKEECYNYLENDDTREDKDFWKEKIDDWFLWHENYLAEKEVTNKNMIVINKADNSQPVSNSRFWKFIKNQATETEPESIELRIEGDIVDDNDIWVYEWFGEPATAPNAFKEELKEFDGKDLTVWIDSYGGSVFAGASIYNALKEHNGKITVKVDGKAMSAASVIAMAGDEILMSPVAVLMIHNPLTSAYGNMHDLRKVADILDTVKDSIINAYVNKTGRPRNKISQMMDDETWMSSNIAVKEGFADGVLYQDKTDKVEDVQNFSFNRLAVMNSANQSIDNAIKLFEKPQNNNEEAEKQKLLMELDLI